MKLYAQLALMGLMAAGGMMMSTGCEVEGPAPAVVYHEPTVGYAYYNDDYYGRGHWDGDYWAWRDRDGHYFHEQRAMHERRMRDHAVRGGERHEEHEEHEHH
jgi:hypothetical protein